MKKSQISKFLRSIGLIYTFDWLLFFYQRFKNRRLNQKYISEHPGIRLPPDYLMYESYQLDYRKYYIDGIDTARWLISCLEKHIKLKNIRILDWGCGPGRIIRHLPELINNGCVFYGTDVNAKAIEWCSENLPEINFNLNTIEARLPYPSNFFEVVYGISIFTHLSKEKHIEWYNELFRILNPDGIILLTTQGDNYKVKLTPAERQQYDAGELVVRGKVKEGHRTFSAFQPERFMKSLFQNADVLEHIILKQEGSWIPQDIWIIKKHSV